MSPLPAEKHYSYADLLQWDEDVRVELIYGQPYMMPSPSTTHQGISAQLVRQLGNYLLGKQCKVYAAPFDVRPFEQQGDSPYDVDTVVQPDISVICDPNKLDDAGCHGAPDLVIEILSPSNHRHDRLTKFDIYQKAAVQEFWLVDPTTRTVSVYSLEDGAYHAALVFPHSASVPVGVLQDCSIDLSTVFPNP